MSRDTDAARQFAELYRSKGWQALPSRPSAKQPMIPYADAWDRPIHPDPWESCVTTNVQVMTGRYWGLLVIDLDGLEAQRRWRWDRTPRTWISRSSVNGLHLWFTIDPREPRKLPKVFLWQGDSEHAGIERLCDRSLVVAPPSVHPKTGNRYFFDNTHPCGTSPSYQEMPARCPSWVLALKQWNAPERPRLGSSGFGEILAGVPSKVALAESWGLRIGRGRRDSAWVPCHAIDREDRIASAAIHRETGYYVDLGSGVRLKFLDLGVALGVAPTAREVLQTITR